MNKVKLLLIGVFHVPMSFITKIILLIFIGMMLFLLCAFKVHDGDSFTLDDGIKIRLHGIDAPEVENKSMRCDEQLCTDKNGHLYKCATKSKAFLYNLLEGKKVECTNKGMSYRRVVGECKSNGVDISKAMILAGWAVEDKRYSEGKYTIYEEAAIASKAGIWQGRMMMPWDYRKSCRK